MSEEESPIFQALKAVDMSQFKVLDSFGVPETIRKDITTSLNNYSGSVLDLSKIELPTFDFSSFTKSLSETFESIFSQFERFNPTIAQAAIILAQHKWWIVPSMPIIFYQRIVELERELTTESVTNSIVKYMNKNRQENLERIVDKWKANVFQRRTEIFQQALWAHARKKYAITVPALIVQVEGIIREFVSLTDSGYTSWRLEPIMNRLKQKFYQLERADREEKMKFEDVEAVMNYHNLRTLEKLFSAYDPRTPTEPNDVNRHAVSHGLWLSYSTNETSTKLFLLLDMLHLILEQLES